MKKVIPLILALATMTAQAQPLSVVHSSECNKLHNQAQPFMLVLKKGENVSGAIVQCIKEAGLPGASFTGIGALKDLTLNYYNLSTKQFQSKQLPQIYELDTLTGDVANSKDGMVAHMHGIISDDKYQVQGGHIASATVAITAEITVTPYKGRLEKRKDRETGVDLLTSG